MKKYLKTYRSFFPDIYTLIMLVVLPVALFFINMAMVHVHSAGALGFSVFLLMILNVYADYFIFSGIFTKGYDFGILKCSLNARDVLKNGIITDQIKRFFQIALVMTINSAWMLANGTLDSTRFILMVVTLVFFTYSASTVVLLIVRKISQYTIYYVASGTLVAIFGTVAVLLPLFSYLKGFIDQKILLFIAVFLSLVSTRMMTYAIKKYYDRSFKEAA